MSDTLLSLRGVGRRLGGRMVLSGIDLDVRDGEFLVLLGQSGCGKSTLLRLLAGLDAPDAGTLAWAGAPRDAAPLFASHDIGFVFQDATLLPWASALENVTLPLRLRGAARAEAAREGQALLDLVGLDDAAAKRPGALSGGMRMRVAIARALAVRPRLLLMDEPFAALDEFTRHRLQDDLLAITAQSGCTTVFVTHSLYEAAYLADRIVVMAHAPGRVAQIVTAADARPRGRLDPAYLDLLRQVQAASDAARGAM